MDSQEALSCLRNGNKRFIEQSLLNKIVTGADRERLSYGQQPYAAIVCCSDSRVSPEIIFDTSLNEIFVVRNAGNIVTNDVVASLEYAVNHLKVPLIVILGHSNCGAINTVCEMLIKDDFTCSESIKTLLDEILPSAVKNKNSGDIKILTEYDNIRHSKQKIMENPVVNECTTIGMLDVVCARYDLVSGEVEFFL